MAHSDAAAISPIVASNINIKTENPKRVLSVVFMLVGICLYKHTENLPKNLTQTDNSIKPFLAGDWMI